MGAFDVALLRLVNGWPEALSPFLRTFSVASDWKTFRLAMFLVLVLLVVLRHGRTALLSLLAFPVADGLCNLLKHAFPMHRPFQELPNVVLRVGPSTSMGTASSHAANMAAVATVMSLGLGVRWSAPWIVVAFLVGLSRVYVGAHYPFQVLLGWTVGVAVGYAAWRLADRLVPQPRKCAEVEQPSV